LASIITVIISDGVNYDRTKLLRSKYERYVRNRSLGMRPLYGIRRSASRPAVPRPIRVEKLAAFFINTLVGVRAEIIPLGLEQIRRKAFAAVTVEVGKRAGKGRDGDAALHRRGNNPAPRGLSLFNNACKEGIEQKVFQVRLFVKGFFNLA